MTVVKKAFGASFALFLCHSVYATPVWSDLLTGWNFVLNEGVAYITSQQLPENCVPARAEIKMSGAEYDKAIFNFTLSAHASGDDIQVVVDDTAAQCVVMGIQ